jgi:hypothetical protein
MLDMVMTNGSAMHRHQIYNFTLTDISREENLEGRTYEDQCIQRIHIKGSFADANIKGGLSSKK